MHVALATPMRVYPISQLYWHTVLKSADALGLHPATERLDVRAGTGHVTTEEQEKHRVRRVYQLFTLCRPIINHPYLFRL